MINMIDTHTFQCGQVEVWDKEQRAAGVVPFWIIYINIYRIKLNTHTFEDPSFISYLQLSTPYVHTL